MQTIDIDDVTIDPEEEAWKAFQMNGAFCLYDNGRHEIINSLVFSWYEEDYEDGESSFGFWAGYLEPDGTLMDHFNVCHSAFEALFPNDKADWNDSESHHKFYCPSNETIEQTMARVSNVLTKAGFTWDP